MLYFGEDGYDARQTQQQASSSSSRLLCPPAQGRQRSSSSAAAQQQAGSRRTGAAGTGPAYASGRDASGHLRTGVNSTSIMMGTYANLTYGGSVQF